VAGLSIDRSGLVVAFVESDSTTPGEVAVIDTDRGEVRRLTRLTTDAISAVDGMSVAGFEPRTFSAPDGVTVHGWVMRPAVATSRGPLLLDVHGGPHNAWAPVFDGIHLYQHMLVARGWTVLIINPRGSDGYGEDFYTALIKDGWGQADTQDFLCAVDALIAEGSVDPNRVAVTGYSYGGFTTTSLTARTDRFAAAVAGGLVGDLVSWAGSFDVGEVWARAELGATVADNLDRLLAQSPITDVGKVGAPTLILHGADDHRCPVGQAEQWFSALRSQGVDTEMVLYPGEGHLFILNGRPSHRVDYNQRIVDWLTRHLP
jgi:dipeptidyl aminopeptidase/acylaminoacyl peptidase